VNKRVYMIPQGAHNWGNRTIEQPLTVLWAAQTIYPDLFKDVDLLNEVKGFYQRFFNANLTDDQVREILSGRVGTP
jgi:iron complex transport system substrate-binding protein